MRTLSPYKYVTGSSEFELPFFWWNFCEIFVQTTYWQQKSVLYIVRGLSKGGDAYVLKMAMSMRAKENSAEKFVKIIPETVYWGEKSVLL